MFGLSIPSDFILKAVVALVPMALSLTVHEFSHAWAAYKLGDDTAARQGRLTLSPLAHLDVIGSILIPLFSVFSTGVALIGWARPVPVSPQRFNRKVTMRTGMILTAAAGPLSNLLLAVVAVSAWTLVARYAPGLLAPLESRESGVAMLLGSMFRLNIGLFVFNLFPIPPLDGSRLLPRSMDGLVAQVAPYSFIILLVILNVAPRLFYLPVQWVGNGIEMLFRTGGAL